MKKIQCLEIRDVTGVCIALVRCKNEVEKEFNLLKDGEIYNLNIYVEDVFCGKKVTNKIHFNDLLTKRDVIKIVAKFQGWSR